MFKDQALLEGRRLWPGLVCILLLFPVAAGAQVECEENMSLVTDLTSAPGVLSVYTTTDDNWGNLYVMLHKGIDTYLMAMDVRGIIDGDPETEAVITPGDSVILGSAFPPVSFDMLEQGPRFADDWAALALGLGGVGLIGASASNLSSATLSSVPIPQGVVWDVKAVPASSRLAHIFAAAGRGGMHMLDFQSSSQVATWLGSVRLPGDARAVEASVVPQDTLLMVANGQGVWVFRSNATKPIDVFWGAAAARDPLTHRMLVFPGAYQSPTQPAWAFDLVADDWTLLETSGTGPWGRLGGSAVYDSQRHRVILYGGWSGSIFSPTGPFFSPWALDLTDNSWQTLVPDSPDSLPPDGNYRVEAATVFDPSHDRILIVGGYWWAGFTQEFGDQTWAFNFSDSSWTVIAGDPGDAHPSPRAGAGAAYVPGIEGKRPPRVILYGGEELTTGKRFDDLWALDCNTDMWTSFPTFGVPAVPRAQHAAIYDADRDRVVFFGDTLGSQSIEPEVIWFLDMADSAPNPYDVGAEWGVYRPPFVSLPPRIRMAAIYDSLRGGAVIFSGQDSTAFREDLQLLDFSDWQWSRILPQFLFRVDSLETPGSAEELALWGDTVFVADGLEGVSVIHAGGLRDTTDTLGFAVVDTIPVEGYAHQVQVRGDYLYVAARSGGVQAFLAAAPDSGVVGSYGRLDHVETLYPVGWGMQNHGPTDSAFLFVADEERFSIIHHERADSTAPQVALALVEKVGFPGRFSSYALSSECLLDTLFLDDGLSHWFEYAFGVEVCYDSTFEDTTETGDTIWAYDCSTEVVVVDSTRDEAGSILVDLLDAVGRVYGSTSLIDIRSPLDRLDSLANAQDVFVVQDSLRLVLHAEAADLARNVGVGREAYAVGTVDGDGGGTLMARDPRITLTVMPGSFHGRVHFYFLEESDHWRNLSRGPGLDGFLPLGGPDPSAQGLEGAGRPCGVGWTSGRPLEPLLLSLPLEGTAVEAYPDEVGIYRLEGSSWELVGGTVEGERITAAIDRSGLFRVLTGERPCRREAPVSLLRQNVPNPFNPLTRISYRLPEGDLVSLRIYDVQGRLIRALFEGYREAGEGSHVWDGRDDRGRGVAAGIYFYRLETARGMTDAKKMVLVK